MTDAFKSTLDYIRKEIRKNLCEKTGKDWTVTCEAEYMDFCFIAKVGVGSEEYSVRSASYDLVKLSNTPISYIIFTTVQMMVAHYNLFGRRKKEDEESRGGVDNTGSDDNVMHD